MSTYKRPKIDADLVKHLSNLSKINLQDSEVKSLQSDMENMLDMVEKLNEVDVDGVLPMPTPSSEQNVLREDEPKQPLDKAESLKNAPITDGQYFKVPKVVSKNS